MDNKNKFCYNCKLYTPMPDTGYIITGECELSGGVSANDVCSNWMPKDNMDDKAMHIVREYALAHLDKSDITPEFSVFIVWKSKILQNWKYLISTSLYDGMYYELTYDGDKKCWYLDAYKKFENKVIK